MTEVSWLNTTNAAEVFQLFLSNLSALDCSCLAGVPMDASGSGELVVCDGWLLLV